MLELLSCPLIIVFRFGIEVDDALRGGGSGFPGESNAGKEYADCFEKISQRSLKR